MGWSIRWFPAIATCVCLVIALAAIPVQAHGLTASTEPGTRLNRAYPGILAERRNDGVVSGVAGAGRLGARAPFTTCSPQWRQVEASNGTWNNALGGVAASSPTSIIAVGISQDASTGNDMDLVERWDGTGWQKDTISSPGSAGSDLTDVAAASGFAWASGIAFTGPTSFYATAFVYTAGWMQMGGLSLPGNSYFNQVAALDTSHVWFVGATDVGSGPVPEASLWDGSTWHSYTPAPVQGQFNSVYMTSATDIWVAGYYVVGAHRQTLIMHFDGTTWVEALTPDVAGLDNTLLHITATSSTDALAVGYTTDLVTKHHAPIAIHLGGTTWSFTSTPVIQGTGDNVLGGLAQKSATDAWAVGFWRPDSTSPRQPLVEHWDGAAWSVSSSADIVQTNNELDSVAEPAAGDVWGVGYLTSQSGIDRNLTENLDPTTAPTGVSAVSADNQTSVFWTAPCSDGGSTIASYVVTARDGCTIEGSQVINGAPPATTLVFSGLTNGVAVSFTVAAVNAYGNGPPSSPTGPIKPIGSAPPYITACTTNQYQLTLSDGSTWQDVDTNGLAATFTPAADSWAILSANADLWTTNAGFNQDIGITVAGPGFPTVPNQPEAWKESGGFAGNFSPNAAYVQTVISVSAGQTYSARLQWKTNRSDYGTIAIGAGPIDGAYSPTRLTVQLLPKSAMTVYNASSITQYTLTNNNGSTWSDMDPTNLMLSFTTPASASGWLMVISANADLWTANAGFNQDIGVAYNGGSGGQPQAWKESGGFAGTFSPNAAFVQLPIAAIAGGTPVTAKLQWKANKPDSGTIFAGAGPIGGRFSPTTLTAYLLPNDNVAGFASSTSQYTQPNSDGLTWIPIDTISLRTGATGAGLHHALIMVNVDLWTSVAGYNQDVGILAEHSSYGHGTIVAWKESGGFAGTFSPNAAFLMAVVTLDTTGSNFTVVWKANTYASVANSIWAGAGPINTNFSPTRLTGVIID